MTRRLMRVLRDLRCLVLGHRISHHWALPVDYCLRCHRLRWTD